jgi:hypothetical protein
MSHGHFVRALREYGVGGTFKKLYKMRTLKFGRLVGVDKYGNQYFENTEDYPHGAWCSGRCGHMGQDMKGTIAGMVRSDAGQRHP